MRNIMRKEQAQKVSMLNPPIDFLAARQKYRRRS